MGEKEQVELAAKRDDIMKKICENLVKAKRETDEIMIPPSSTIMTYARIYGAAKRTRCSFLKIIATSRNSKMKGW